MEHRNTVTSNGQAENDPGVPARVPEQLELFARPRPEPDEAAAAALRGLRSKVQDRSLEPLRRVHSIAAARSYFVRKEGRRRRHGGRRPPAGYTDLVLRGFALLEREAYQ